MNNNNNNGGGKESDIITKKGFLISLPGKKNSDSSTSSINLASTRNSSELAKNDDGNKQKNKDNKKRHDFKKNRHDKNSGTAPSANDHNKSQEENRNAGAHDRNNDKNKNNRNDFRDKKNDGKNLQQNKDKNHRNDKKPSRPENNRNDGAERETKENSFKKDNRNDRPKNDNQNPSANKGKNFDHGKNKHKHDKRDRNDRREERVEAPKQAPLSALSKDIAQAPLHTSSPIADFKPANDELSLEEKYKNAKPLAEQIAEQEMRAKGIKIPYDNEKPIEEEKQEIVGVRFREAGKIYYFDPEGVQIPFGTPVIVETARGSEYGFIAISNRLVPTAGLTAPLKKIERLATPSDTQQHNANKELEIKAEDVFREKVAKLGLEMTLIYVEYTFDNSRLLFYFTAETRIDFRELVKELASVFRTRIELRQIGVRDEAKAIGGLGVCGRATCCNTFLGDFAQVSIKMAKDQSLSLNAAKISGSCGKLMCCLRYEDKVYEDENARTPKVGSIVETPEGKGHVVERNVLCGIVKVALDLAPEAPAKPFSREEVTVIGFNKQKSDEGINDEDLKELKDAEG